MPLSTSRKGVIGFQKENKEAGSAKGSGCGGSYKKKKFAG